MNKVVCVFVCVFVCLSVCHVLVLHRNDLTCQHFFIIVAQSFQFSNLCEIPTGSPPYGGVEYTYGVLNLLNLAPETVILDLVRSKCMSILLYGLESCQLSNADLRSLNFTFNRLFMKLFKTKSIDVVKACHCFTGSEVPSCLLKRKTNKFILNNVILSRRCRYY